MGSRFGRCLPLLPDSEVSLVSIGGQPRRFFTCLSDSQPTPTGFSCYTFPMKGETKERWMQVCELITQEQDPQKFLALVSELNELLAQKERRLAGENKTAE
jgi:hypothetical protein